MKIKLNPIFFGGFFLAALLAEGYSLLVLEADILTIGGLGVVILISLYLLLDSIRGQWKQWKEKTLFYLEHLYREETEKSDIRYTELLNLHKATYTAAKKKAATLEVKMEELMIRLQSMEKSNEEALNKVVELQKKLVDGQKNALNIEVNYQKDNTKALIAAIREEAGMLHHEDKFELILEALKELPFRSDKLDTPRSLYEEDSLTEEWLDQEPELTEMSFLEEGPSEEEEPSEDEQLPVQQSEDDIIGNSDAEIVPLYDDPNKSLTKEEIAALFSSYGK